MSIQYFTMKLVLLAIPLIAATLTGCQPADAPTSNSRAQPAAAAPTPAQPQSTSTTAATPATPETAPMPASTPTTGAKSTQLATFGGGCFWGVEESFRTLKGVTHTAVGFEGGTMDKPSYRDVCTDRTGHAEVVQIEFDPSIISYDQLLDTFWKIHDPTQVNRQGPDYGTQYRTVIFYHSPEQQAQAEASKKRLAASGKFKKPIATAIEPAKTFWKAEEYHQQYLLKNGLSNCHVPTAE